MWNQYKTELTLSQFETSLTANTPKLAKCIPDEEAVDSSVARDWPYSVGYFDNNGEVYRLKRNCQ
jgi:hypothetical protein